MMVLSLSDAELKRLEVLRDIDRVGWRSAAALRRGFAPDRRPTSGDISKWHKARHLYLVATSLIARRTKNKSLRVLYRVEILFTPTARSRKSSWLSKTPK